jgi:hypothetical protein
MSWLLDPQLTGATEEESPTGNQTSSQSTQRKRLKAAPLQAWSGPEGSRKLRLPDFVTTAQDCGKVVSLTHRPPLPPGNTPGIQFC